MDGAFVPGLRLAGEFYAEAVRPLLDQGFPRLRYAAALLGPGSEVLGFDTERQVIGGMRFAAALADAITDPVIRRLPPVGAADQFIDSTDALGDLSCPRAVINAREGKPG